jgi:hypothetical protein
MRSRSLCREKKAFYSGVPFGELERLAKCKEGTHATPYRKIVINHFRGKEQSKLIFLTKSNSPFLSSTTAKPNFITRKQ